MTARKASEQKIILDTQDGSVAIQKPARQMVIWNSTAIALNVSFSADPTTTPDFIVPGNKVAVTPPTTIQAIRWHYASAPTTPPAAVYLYPNSVFTPGITP